MSSEKNTAATILDSEWDAYVAATLAQYGISADAAAADAAAERAAEIQPHERGEC